MPRRTRLQRLLNGELQELLRLAQEHDLAELDLERNGLKLRLSRDQSGELHLVTGDDSLAGQQPAAALADTALWLRAPIIGRFYFDASLASGQLLAAGQRLGHIDTLDLITEVVAEAASEVIDVLVEEGQGVEYSQPLFALRPQEPG